MGEVAAKPTERVNLWETPPVRIYNEFYTKKPSGNFILILNITPQLPPKL